MKQISTRLWPHTNEERRPPPRKDGVPFLPYRNPHLRNSGKIVLTQFTPELCEIIKPRKGSKTNFSIEKFCARFELRIG